jgi:hypothetical protein
MNLGQRDEPPTAGRMNPSGIALFYGALELETCLAEVRPPVGSQVVCGAFLLRRTVLLLDLTLLPVFEAEGRWNCLSVISVRQMR